jgi:hypothetical protein
MQNNYIGVLSMKFAIDYRSMHTAIHGLFIYEEQEKCEDALEVLQNIENVTNEEEYQFLIDEATKNIYTCEEEIHYGIIDKNRFIKNMKYYVNNNGYVSPEIDNIRVLNQVMIDLYI